jgi:hypothetical protein
VKKTYGLMAVWVCFSAASVWAQDNARPVGAGEGGPPAFVSLPLTVHAAKEGVSHGNFVWSEGRFKPAPLVRSVAPGTAAPASFTSLNLTMGTDFSPAPASDSYEGETGAASTAVLLVGGANHIYPGACSTSAAPGTFGDCAPLAFVTSDGITWTRSSMSRTWNNSTLGIGFDPAIDVDKNGTFFFSYGVAPLSSSYPNGIVVMKSADGVTWTKATPVTFNKKQYFDDKYYLAIDRSNSPYANRIYVAWDRNSGNDQILQVAYSSNGGSTWTSPIKVNDGTSKFERVIGAYPAVAPQTAGGVTQGTVFVSWHDYARNVIYADKSTDGGATWGKDVAVATTHTGFGQDIGCVGGRRQSPAHAMKVGPSGAIYLVYADSIQNRGYDVLFSKSVNGGASWSTPVRINDDSGSAHQFQPTLTVESNGSGGDKITVSFYDRRDDPSNCLTHVYSTQSTDSGAHWSANVRQTTEPSNFDGNPNGPGDYSSSAPFGGGVFPFFSDHRSSNSETAPSGSFDVFTVKIQ